MVDYLPVWSRTKPAMGGPRKAATPRTQVSAPKAVVSISIPRRSTSMEEVMAGAAEMEKPNRTQLTRNSQ